MKFDALKRVLGEKQRRLYLAVEAKAIGRGGASQVAKASGVSRGTINAGLAELAQVPPPTDEALPSKEGKKQRKRTRAGRLPVAESKRHRKAGGGRKRTTTLDLSLTSDLEALIISAKTGEEDRS